MKSQEQKELMRRVFEKYTSEATMQAIMSAEMKVPNLTKTTVDFILIKIREHPLESFLECLEAIMDTALQNEALVEQVMSSLVLITYGVTEAVPPSEEKRKRLANELIEHHGENVALIEGRQETLAGRYGGPFRATFGSIIQNLWGLLGKLAELDYGEAKMV
jgi:hypothetical protein